MATTIPVMRGKLGTVEYYLTTMKAAEAVAKIRTADQLPNWADLSIEEIMQRQIDWGRVKNEIARFMAKDDDRFFGAILVAIYDTGGMDFESIADVMKGAKVYANAAKAFGFLHLNGGEVWFALDGQHRLKGTEVAMSGVDEKGRRLDEFEPNLDIASDDLAVMLIPFDPAQRARKVFNKVNKYAKQTGKGENIITSEDDAFAIVTRWLMGGGGHEAVIPEKLVNWTSNTLTKRTPKFTTISVLYDAARALLERSHGKIDTQFRPTDAVLNAYYAEVKELWESLLREFAPFRDALEGPVQDLSDLRESLLAMKPAGQSAVLEAVAIARRHDVPYELIIKGLNKIDWRLDADEWQGIIMQNAKIQAGRTPVFLAARLIAHRIGVPFSDDEKRQLLREYQKAKGQDPDAPKLHKTLPNQLVKVPAAA